MAAPASGAGRASPTLAPPERIRLAGPSPRLDPRIHAVRADIADVALAGRVFAPHYTASVPRAGVPPATALRAEPADDARAVSELLLGEGFALLDVAGGWAWGYCRHDGYVGYLPAATLGPVEAVSHVVAAPAALVFAAPDIKAPVLARWPMGARFAAVPEGDFLATATGWVHRRHAAAIDAVAPDPVAVAERLVGIPYRWGGRSGDGIDCSGLVQLALGLAGIAAPRDSDQQQALGAAVPAGAPLARGDLVFFPGHVGVMADAGRLVHANAWWMAVTIEPLADVVARLKPGHAEPVIAVRRLR